MNKKMLQIIPFCISVFFNFYCSNNKMLQQKEIQVTFTIDDSVQNITDSFKIYFINGRDTLKGLTEKDLLKLPDIKKDTTYTIIFNYKSYFLSFNGVSKKMIIPNQNIEWKFGIDNKPFNNLLGLLSNDEYKTDTITNKLIYFQFDPKEHGDGIQFVQKK